MPTERVQAMVKAYRTKHPDMTDEEEKMMIADLNEETGGEEQTENWLDNLSKNAEKLNSLPPEAREYAVRLMTLDSISPSRTAKPDATQEALQFAKQLMLMKTMLNQEDPKGADPEVKEMIKGLEAQVVAMKDEKQQAEYQQLLDDMKEQFGDKLEAIEARLGKGGETVDVNPIKKAADDMKTVIANANELREAAGLPPIDLTPKKEEAKPQSVEEMQKELEAHGYEVQGPMTPKQMKEHFDLKVAEVRAETERKVRADLKADDKRNAMLFDLGSTFLESVVPVLGNTGAKKGLTVAANALKVAKGMAE